MCAAYFIGNNSLPNLKLEKRETQGTIVPIFKVQFSSPDGFALYYLEFFDGLLEVDWSVEGNEPRVPRTWLLIKPDPALCQSRVNPARFSCNPTDKENEIQVNYKILNQFFSGLLVFMSGNFTTSHQAA